MSVARSDRLAVRSGEDLLHLRQMVRQWAVDIGFGLLDQTRIVTAASELGRNMVDFAGGGVVRLEELADLGRRGLRLTFEDHGPGIPDVELALRDGYSTGSGLGLGLGGARRLVNEFSIASKVGSGTTVAITRWR